MKKVLLILVLLSFLLVLKEVKATVTNDNPLWSVIEVHRPDEV